MAVTKQQRPTQRYIALHTGLAPRTVHVLRQSDLLVAAGWSRTAARQMGDREVMLDFIVGPSDGFTVGSYMVHVYPRLLTRSERFRLWLLNHLFARRDWDWLDRLLPAKGTLLWTR